jgi:hypothetical protein
VWWRDGVGGARWENGGGEGRNVSFSLSCMPFINSVHLIVRTLGAFLRVSSIVYVR